MFIKSLSILLLTSSLLLSGCGGGPSPSSDSNKSGNSNDDTDMSFEYEALNLNLNLDQTYAIGNLEYDNLENHFNQDQIDTDLGVLKVSDSGQVEFHLKSTLSSIYKDKSTDFTLNRSFNLYDKYNNKAIINITVTGVDDAPKANNDVVEIVRGESSYQINPLTNDVDIDNDNNQITLNTLSAMYGQVLKQANSIVYTPHPEYNTDEVSYSILSNGKTDNATISITINESELTPQQAIDSLDFANEIAPPYSDEYRLVFKEHQLPSVMGKYQVKWSSDFQEVNFIRRDEQNEQVVFSHPSAKDEAKTVNLIATIEDNFVEYTKTINVKLLPKPVLNTNVLVIRVKFQDSEFMPESTQYSEAQRMFANGYSVSDYFAEASHGRANLIPAPMPPVDNSNMVGTIIDDDLNDGVIEYHYPGNQERLKYPSILFVRTILNDIDSYVGFSNFDTNNNKVVESSELNLFFNFATCSRAHTMNLCYPHNNDYEAAEPGYWPAASRSHHIITPDGVRVGGSTSSRIAWTVDYDWNKMNHPVPTKKYIEHFSINAHELGHSIFNMPDLYNRGNTTAPYTWTNLTVGNFGLMSNPFLYLDDKRTPQHPTSDNKVHAGFVDPIYSTPYMREVDQSVDLYNFNEADSHPLIMSKQSSMSDIYNDQYLIANMRSQLHGYDRTLEPNIVNDGVLIAHINRKNYSNVRATNFLEMVQKLLHPSEDLFLSVSINSFLFETGHQLTSATKFHDLVNQTENSVDTGFLIPEINQTSDTSFNLLLTQQ